MKHHLIDIAADGVAWLTLNSPGRGNPLSPALTAELYQALLTLDEDPGVRIVVIRGAGRHFCSGADLSGDLALEVASLTEDDVAINSLLELLNGLGTPTVALVHGACIGGGLALAACCDVIVAEHSAFFSIPELALGFPPAPMTPFFLQLMGWPLLRRYALTGERLSASDAFRLGMVHKLVGAATLEEDLQLILSGLRRAAPLAVRRYKQILQEHSPVGPAAFAAAREAGAAMAAALNTTEAREGFAAFTEKRKPEWDSVA